MHRFGKFLLIYAGLTAFLLYSLPVCNRSKTYFVIASARAPVEEEDNVKFQGFVLGKVSSVKQYKDSLLIGYKLFKNQKLPPVYTISIGYSVLGKNYLSIIEDKVSRTVKKQDTMRAVMTAGPELDSAERENTIKAIRGLADMLIDRLDSANQ